MTATETVNEVLARVLLIDEQELTPKSDLREDLGMDSLDLVDITMELEEALLDGDPIGEDSAARWRTVEDIQIEMEKLAARPIGKSKR